MKTRATNQQPPKQTPTPASQLYHGHDEMHNFAVFPLALLSDKGSKNIKTYYYEDDQEDPRTGRLIRRKVIITSADAFGLPTATDEEVLLGLLYLTVFADFPSDRRVHFSRHQLLQLLSWKPTTENYRRLRLSFSRWKGITVLYENWWDATAQQPATKGFGILESFDLYDDRCRARAFTDRQAELPLSHIVWNETPYNSFRQGRKDLNLHLFFQLPTAAAKRAYRYLDTQLPPGDEPRTYDLRSFACERVGLSRAYKPSRLLKEVQEDVVQPLEEAEFIIRFKDWKQRYRTQGRGNYQVTFARKPQPEQLLTPTAAAAEQPAASTTSPLLAELKRFGVGGKVARDFLATHEAEYIEQKIDFLASLIDTGKAPKNQAGWLRRALEEDYGPPPGYLPRSEREQQRKAAEEKQRQKAENERQKQEAARRQQDREEAESQRKREHLDRVRASLTPAELQEILRLAKLDAAEPFRKYFEQSDDYALHMQRVFIDIQLLKRFPLPKLARAE